MKYVWIAWKSYRYESPSIKTWLPVMLKKIWSPASCVCWWYTQHIADLGVHQNSTCMHDYVYIYTYSICIYVYIHIWGLFKIMVPQNCYTHPYLQMFIYDPSYLICVVKHCQIPQLPITGIRMPKILSSAHASRPFWADGFDLATLVALKG